MLAKISEQNKQRNLIQSRAVISAGKHNHLVLEWSTGCGKSLAAIKIVQEILTDDPSAEGYIICKESTHRKNWKIDIDKHGYNHILDSIEMLLYASVHKMKKADFIILDECHALTVKRMAIIRDLVGPNTKVIYLSATIPDDKKFLVSFISRSTEKYYKIPLVRAIELGLLPAPEVVVHRVKLNNDDKRIHKFVMKRGLPSHSLEETCEYNERWKIFNANTNIELTVLCNEVEFYNLLTSQMEYFSSKIEENVGKKGLRQAYENKFLNLGSQRKKFIAQAKTEKTKSLVREFRSDNERFLCFTGSIEQSMELGSANSVHSKNKKDYNQDLVDCFNREECSELFAVKMLREGVNLTNVRKGIIVQLDSTIGSFYQMLGRCLRHDFPQMHLLIIEDTQDEVYFASAMKDFDIKFITEK